MGFKLTQSPTFWAPVEVEFAAEKGGKQVVRLEVQYKRLAIDAMREMQERIRDQQLTDAQVAAEIMVGWRGPVGDDDTPLEFSEDNLGKLLNLGFGSAIVLTFFASLPKAKAKN